MSYYDMLLARNLAGGSATLQDKSVTITENGDSTILPDSGYDGLSKVNVSVNVSGGGEAPESGVKFYDYDGTLITSWSADEVASKTELPANPDHSSDVVWGEHTIPLTSQGWNWTLADIKEFAEGHPEDLLEVGQKYVPTDGKTHFLVRLSANLLSLNLKYRINSGTSTIDWGDGTTSQAASMTNNPHTYTSAGDYDISVDGAAYFYTSGYNSWTDVINPQEYLGFVKGLFIGSNYTKIGTKAFQAMSRLEFATIPDGITDIQDNAFNGCNYLYRITIPNDITTIGITAFANCYHLANITIPNNVTSLGGSSFANCYNSNYIVVGKGVVGLGGTFVFSGCGAEKAVVLSTLQLNNGHDHVFSDCHKMKSLRISASAIPAYFVDNNYSLEYLQIDDATQLIGYALYSGLHSLKTLILSDTITTFGQYAVRGAYILEELTLPSGLTNIANYGLGLSCLKKLKFTSATPPILNASGALSIPVSCIIYVPAGSLSAYTTATNYPNPATYTYVEY